MIKMLKLAVLFGGKSTEHNISIVSGTNVIASLNKDKYEIYPIYIDREGTFYKYTKKVCISCRYRCRLSCIAWPIW